MWLNRIPSPLSAVARKLPIVAELGILRWPRPAEAVIHEANQRRIDSGCSHLACEIREITTYLGGRSDRGAHDRDTGSGRQRLLCRPEYAVPPQVIWRHPVNGIRRAVVEPDHQLGVRARELNAVDSSFD